MARNVIWNIWIHMPVLRLRKTVGLLEWQKTEAVRQLRLSLDDLERGVDSNLVRSRLYTVLTKIDWS